MSAFIDKCVSSKLYKVKLHKTKNLKLITLHLILIFESQIVAYCLLYSPIIIIKYIFDILSFYKSYQYVFDQSSWIQLSKNFFITNNIIILYYLFPVLALFLAVIIYPTSFSKEMENGKFLNVLFCT